jgi:hypothetical protein
MPESRIHILDAIVTINGHNTLSLRSRRFCCVRRNGAAHGPLACDLLQMGAWVEGGIICAVLYRRSDLDHARWQVKILGIAFALFGITAVVLWVFIYYFQ